ncbi:uncharacterized protein CANTADRAFT_293859 [Suhomyces tanzawaensis NRRL Y-17324]|uniref:RING-type domain-containing protein n=1 Tax=Suhomyces tanzawaensis NRRL Y-17324 TaxID=984487 RepID=A0A1E4SEW0_9ASCO|nr:uncharacterized protein CANTADRAFT_293859 [Suhomyces tanzawaensis NRRL Y-17324]ODV78028.1 hypothetical protein CANTADRAFT_293859 [Suhomyces tanzawaensis NRRL Y-17324]
MSSIRRGEELGTPKTGSDPHSVEDTVHALDEPSAPQTDPQVEEVIEISDDEIEVTDVRPTGDATRRRRSPRRVVHIDEDDDDDLQITGSNPSPAPLASLLPPQQSHHQDYDDDDFDGEIEIINERPIARPPGPAPYNGSRRPVLPLFNRINSMVHSQFGQSEGLSRSRNGFRSRVWVPFSATGRNARGRRVSSITENHLAEYIHSMLQRQQDHPHFDDYGLGDPDAIESSIMNRIERENESAMDQRLANENMFNRKVLQEKKEQALNEKHGYTNNISPQLTIGCELCGVVLGEGIPSDFKPDSRYNENFEKYIKEYRVQAPWFCALQCTSADIDLSKRIFASKCGHVFCGRCVKNIANRPRRTKNTPLVYSITNPSLVSPPKCPGPDCNKKFTAKNFLELYY